jgi:DNA mismatch repair protein MutH
MPLGPSVGQLWYDNNKISVWNGYSWIPVQDNTRTTIRLSPLIERMIAKILLNEAEEEQLKQDFPEIADAYKAYTDLVASAKIVSKMRNSNLANTGT